MKYFLFIAVVFALALPLSGSAQEFAQQSADEFSKKIQAINRLRTGQHIRIYSIGHYEMMAYYQMYDADSIWVKDSSGRRSVAISDMSVLWVHTGEVFAWLEIL